MKKIAYCAALALLPLVLSAVTPKSPSKVCIDDQCATEPEPSTSAKKWHPGWYVLLFRGESRVLSTALMRCDEIARESNIKGLKITLRWRDVEPQKDVYNWTNIRSIYNRCASHGKRLIVDIFDREFGGGGTALDARKTLPDYLIDDPAYGWYAINAYKGVAAKTYKQSVNDRYIRIYQQMAVQFDDAPYFEAIFAGIGESAPGFSGVTPPADYSDLAFFTQYKRRLTAVSAAWKRTNVVQGFNWMSPNSALVEFMRHINFEGAAMGWPDTWGTMPTPRLTPAQKALIGDPLYGGVDYRGKVPIFGEIEAPELGGTCGFDGNYTPAQIMTTAREKLRVNHMIIIRNTCGGSAAQNWGSPGSGGILDFIRANPLTNTACPANYTQGCDSR